MRIITEPVFFHYSNVKIDWAVNEIVSKLESIRNKVKGNEVEIYIFSVINFLSIARKIRDKLIRRGYKIKQVRLEHCYYNMQILGCNIININEIDKIANKGNIERLALFVGDGYFHVIALTKVFDVSNIIMFNPVTNKVWLAGDDKNLKEYKQNIKRIETIAIRKFENAKSIGIFLSTKPGQRFYDDDSLIKLINAYEEKKFYFFLGNDFNVKEVENFSFIDFWVNTACPRLMYDDFDVLKRKLINLDLILRRLKIKA